MDEERLPVKRMRASDADRDAIAERLAGALSEGRLDLTEYDDRLSATMRAKTLGELAELTADLPETAPPPAEAPVPGGGQNGEGRWRERLEPWRGLAAIAVILTGIWTVTSLLSGSLQPFWPAWPIGFMFVFTAAGALSGDYEKKRPRNGDLGRHQIDPDRRRDIDGGPGPAG
ncbi:DUF1707 SHOCT-like domain-containing protein [Nocardiopsis ansamitocini]|uniref:DUF1707 domain-containing protein n=1 Tax=Nocardiopsis ansamitocini TaxID=1670832 RepID=A0A9W6UJ32_9ACTN|nr:DUF1707 domain-containing protein [Nocardiopsis ansamitocini]GLU48078.1 hypothetical protein Nans01_24290 [Nocardiopsis ansamitocini]